GDISGAITTAFESKAIDMLMGIGGAKEGMIAAAALKCLDGDLQSRFVYSSDEERERADEATGGNPDRIFGIGDLVKGNDVMVAITGITDGVLLPGVRYFSGGAETNSILLRQKTHTLRFIRAIHQFDFKPIF
ncbi:MAG: fructose-bisphosphatase class II, partial [Spirochaetes bacterium]|nr:fructose-bisphosphatase class II [Spirochaetota bacterium]